MTIPTGVVDPGVLRARTAVVVAFVMAGVGLAAFLARIPAAREMLDLSTGQLGLLLLCVSVSSVASLPASGPVVARLGPARTVFAGAVSVGLGQALLAAGLALGVVALAGLGLALHRPRHGVWDVAMNVEGADVEQRMGRSLMPRLHAAFSIGTVAGAGMGAACAATGRSRCRCSWR